jgi:hypothetical protein
MLGKLGAVSFLFSSVSGVSIFLKKNILWFILFGWARGRGGSLKFSRFFYIHDFFFFFFVGGLREIVGKGEDELHVEYW